MGKLKGDIEKYRKNQKVGRLEREILKKIESTGILLPFDLYAGGYGSKDNPQRLRKRKYAFKDRLAKMVRKGLLKHSVEKGTPVFKLTTKGEDIVDKISLGELLIEKPWRWNGKRHMVSFDIPEKRRDARDELRSILIALGFANIQKSLWVYPYECREAIELVRRKYHLTREIRYFVVDEVEFDTELRDQFGLPG